MSAGREEYVTKDYFDQSIKSLQKAIEELAKGMEARFDRLHQEMNETRADILDLRTRMSSLENLYTTLNMRVGALEAISETGAMSRRYVQRTPLIRAKHATAELSSIEEYEYKFRPLKKTPFY